MLAERRRFVVCFLFSLAQPNQRQPSDSTSGSDTAGVSHHEGQKALVLSLMDRVDSLKVEWT